MARRCSRLRSRTPSCILLDVNIPGKSGLDILKELHGEDYPAPIFMISGQGDIAMAVTAIKNGALDFIEKPFRGSEIVARLDEAIEAYARRQAENSASRIATLHFPGREPLTRREREVLEQFTAVIQQGSRAPTRDQPAHDRGSSRQHHEEARCAERRRSGPDRDDHPASGLIPCARSRPLNRQRFPDHDRHIRFAIGFGEQQHALVEPAVMDDRVFRIARREQHLQPGLDRQYFVGELAAVERRA